ncbi:MAG: hypothetical protein ACD_37C00308G0004 [uncultured bacterium]|nr:MAG: hypothetical protein ACD_37C00308G0004 [uncultured bacterium]OGH14817.1 MAG: hypothetical protein A2687_00020 [Candidatus Levybacteria bacterium RIFCSPHIGHO2_01_FULL_38_26]
MISFFAKKPYLLDDPTKPGKVFWQRLTARVRAEEIAAYLGAKLNPTQGYENDVCIYIKSYLLNQAKDEASYIDILDDKYTIQLLKSRPNINVIAMSKPHLDFLRTVIKNKIVYIPHHHINIERIRRKRRKIVNCGYIGSNPRYDTQLNQEIGERLKKIGLNFIPYYNYDTREDIIDYYKKIDIQIIGHFTRLDDPYYHQTKIVNAMSFGIPTIASQRLGYIEVKDFFIPVTNLDELVEAAKTMKEPAFYNRWPEKIMAEAEKYHISNIAKLYQSLDNLQI